MSTAIELLWMLCVDEWLYHKQIMDAFTYPCLNSLRPGDAYVRHLTRSPLVQIMACHLLGTKQIAEPMLEYCWLDT